MNVIYMNQFIEFYLRLLLKRLYFGRGDRGDEDLQSCEARPAALSLSPDRMLRPLRLISRSKNMKASERTVVFFFYILCIYIV